MLQLTLIICIVWKVCCFRWQKRHVHWSTLGREFIYGSLRNSGSQDQIFRCFGYYQCWGCWNFLHRYHPAMEPCSWLCHRAAPDTAMSLVRTQSEGARHLTPQYKILLISLHGTAAVGIRKSNFSSGSYHSNDHYCSHRWKEAKSRQVRRAPRSKQAPFIVGDVENALQVLVASWLLLRLKWLRWVLLTSRVLDCTNIGGTPVCTHLLCHTRAYDKYFLRSGTLQRAKTWNFSCQHFIGYNLYRMRLAYSLVNLINSNIYISVQDIQHSHDQRSLFYPLSDKALPLLGTRCRALSPLADVTYPCLLSNEIKSRAFPLPCICPSIRF